MKVQYTWLSQSLCILFLTFKYNIYKFIWVLLWLSSVCWVRTLNTPKWDILTTDVAVYFDSTLSNLKLQTYQSISPAKARETAKALHEDTLGTSSERAAPPEAKATQDESSMVSYC